MAVRPILEVPDPALRTKCEEVAAFDKSLEPLTDEMLETMYDATGRGLAAPQIGILKRVFVMDCRWKEGDKDPRTFVNPAIVAQSDETSSYEEGCLSIPGRTSLVTRPARVEVSWHSIDGTPHRAWFDGFEATCVQHEIDHLDGILCTDYGGID